MTKTSGYSLYAFFWVIPRRLNFICRRFGTLFYLHTYPPMKMEQSVPKRRHISDAGELPRRKHTTFRTRRKFEIKNSGFSSLSLKFKPTISRVRYEVWVLSTMSRYSIL